LHVKIWCPHDHVSTIPCKSKNAMHKCMATRMHGSSAENRLSIRPFCFAPSQQGNKISTHTTLLFGARCYLNAFHILFGRTKDLANFHCLVWFGCSGRRGPRLRRGHRCGRRGPQGSAPRLRAGATHAWLPGGRMVCYACLDLDTGTAGDGEKAPWGGGVDGNERRGGGCPDPPLQPEGGVGGTPFLVELVQEETQLFAAPRKRRDKNIAQKWTWNTNFPEETFCIGAPTKLRGFRAN